MPPLRILHVAPYSDMAWAYGGIPRVVGSVTHALARQGHHVTVCTTDAHTEESRLPRPDRRMPLAPWPVIEQRDGITWRIFPNLSNGAAYSLQAYWPIGFRRYLASHAGSFDVAHLHACRNIPTALAAAALRRCDIPYVLAPNGTAPIIERRQRLKQVFDALGGRRAMQHAAAVVAVSNAERDQLTALSVCSTRIRTIANPVDLEGADRALATTPPRTAEKPPTVLFLGKITPRKNVPLLVSAVAQLGRNDVSLVIAGNDMGGVAQARQTAADTGLQHRTLFTGLLTGDERFRALADADLLVYASEHEVFGLVPLEALLMGTPVIVADDSGAGELVTALGGGLVVPVNDRDALAAAIADILDHREHWRAAARQAARRIRERYSGAAIGQQVSDMYAELIHARPERPQ